MHIKTTTVCATLTTPFLDLMGAIYCEKVGDNKRLAIVVKMEVPQQLSVEEAVERSKNTCLES